MKKMKKLVTMLVVAICVLLPLADAMPVSAATPYTYYVKYIADKGTWGFQSGSSAWDDSKEYTSIVHLNTYIKDGDIVIVDGNNPNSKIDIGVSLSNLTLYANASAVVSAKSITECYALHDSVCAVNGDVTTAYVFDNATATFNNNVGTLYVQNTNYTPGSLLYGTVTVGGTVDHLIGKDLTRLHYEHYSFAAGKLSIDKGTVKTNEAFYSKTAPVVQPTPVAPSTGSADEYDDVPKTGESNAIFWLLGISLVACAGSLALCKTEKSASAK